MGPQAPLFRNVPKGWRPDTPPPGTHSCAAPGLPFTPCDLHRSARGPVPTASQGNLHSHVSKHLSSRPSPPLVFVSDNKRHRKESPGTNRSQRDLTRFPRPRRQESHPSLATVSAAPQRAPRAAAPSPRPRRPGRRSRPDPFRGEGEGGRARLRLAPKVTHRGLGGRAGAAAGAPTTARAPPSRAPEGSHPDHAGGGQAAPRPTARAAQPVAVRHPRSRPR